jgi:hypothetical protein
MIPATFRGVHMRFEHDGRRYELLRGSNVQNDTMYLELWDVGGRKPVMVLFGEKHASGEIRFLSAAATGFWFRKPILLPLGLVERFIDDLKEML